MRNASLSLLLLAAIALPAGTATSAPTTPTPTPTPIAALACLDPPAVCTKNRDCCSNICSGPAENKTCQPAPTPTPTATPVATPTAMPLQLIDEEPSNDDIATAAIQITPTQTLTTVTGMLLLATSLGDTDYLGIGGLLAGNVVEVSTTPLGDSPFFENPDTIVGVFTDNGVAECIGDDSYNNDLDPVPTGFGSLCRVEVPADGDYFVGVTGYSTVPFDGAHSELGWYSLTVSVTQLPEPGAMLQLTLGALGVVALHARRRRANG